MPFVSQNEEPDGSFRCLSGVNAHCANAHIPYTDFGFQLYVSEIVYVLGTGTNVVLALATSTLSTNTVAGINAMKCTWTHLGENAWRFIASLWWFLKMFNSEDQLKEFLKWSYPMVCTCASEVDLFAILLGSRHDQAEAFEFCSEEVREEALTSQPEFNYRSLIENAS